MSKTREEIPIIVGKNTLNERIYPKAYHDMVELREYVKKYRIRVSEVAKKANCNYSTVVHHFGAAIYIPESRVTEYQKAIVAILEERFKELKRAFSEEKMQPKESIGASLRFYEGYDEAMKQGI